MPCIRCTLNKKIGKEQSENLKKGFMEAIQLIPGKNPETLMVILQDSADMCFHCSSDIASAFVEVNILLRADPTESFQKMSSVICNLLERELDIEGQNIYIRYTATKDWAWNSINF